MSRLVQKMTLVCLALAISEAFDPTPVIAERVVYIPGVDASRLAAKQKGLVLVNELKCVSCHSSAVLSTSSKKAPRLATIGRRVNPHYLERFIAAPHETKPGLTMPDVMGHLSVAERADSARAIAHFLLSLDKSRDFQIEAIDTVAAEHGQRLFHSVGCVACHSPRDENGAELLPNTSVALGSLEKKYNTRGLREFLRSPDQVRPSGRMPNMQLSPRDAERIASYLLRKTKAAGHLYYTLIRGRVWEGLEVNVEKEKAGHVDDFDLTSLKQLQHNSAIIYEGFIQVDKPGQYEFFLEMNGGELWLGDNRIANLEPSGRRGVKKVQAQAVLADGWNKLKLVYIHAGKEPKFRFEMTGPEFKRGPIPSSKLSVSDTPIEPLAPYPLDSKLVEQGRQAFGKLGCANCHDDVRVAPQKFRPFSELVAHRGCLSGSAGNWPRYSLKAEHLELLGDALPQAETMKLNALDKVNTTLVTFNCIACHERADLGGVTPERDIYFTGTKKELGNQGRIPPPLTLVGAKLPKEWLSQVLNRGAQQREYMATTMPQFGESNVGHLVDRFAKVDSIESANFAKITDIQEYQNVGRELIGTKGFSCIACHDFNGQKAAGPGAMEMVHTTARLKKDYFYWFMLNPARFRPRIVMPSAWPNGHVFKEDLLGGDAKRQIESIWVYLEDGVRAKSPVGLSRKSPELRVADEAVICRGRGPAGYRGIAVGYPERLSLAFDSQEMTLRWLWKGEFANVDHGRFSPRGGDRIEFPPGIPFHRLESMDDNWPYKRKTDYLFPQDHGYQFRGYFLGELKRPTFMYEYGDVRVKDYFEDLLTTKDKRAYFRRTFTFDSPTEQERFYFRAGSGRKITRQPDGSFVVDRLTLTLKSDHEGMIRDGEPKELLVPVQLPSGKSRLILEYKW